MDPFIASATNLGVAGLAIAALVIVVRELTRSHSDSLNKREEIFVNYVEANNHQKTALIEKAIVAITQASDAQKATGEAIKEHTREHANIVAALIKNR